MPAAKKRKDPLERDIQIAIMQYCDIALKQRGYFFHVPNGGHRHPAVAAKMKAEGVKRGVADICCMLPEGKVLWVEVKTRTGSMKPEQKAFKETCEKLGHTYVLVRSVNEFIKLFQ